MRNNNVFYIENRFKKRDTNKLGYGISKQKSIYFLCMGK